MFDIYIKIMETHICLTFTKRKMGQFYSEKEAKNERKSFIVNERALCGSLTKLSGTFPPEN